MGAGGRGSCQRPEDSQGGDPSRRRTFHSLPLIVGHGESSSLCPFCTPKQNPCPSFISLWPFPACRLILFGSNQSTEVSGSAVRAPEPTFPFRLPSLTRAKTWRHGERETCLVLARTHCVSATAHPSQPATPVHLQNTTPYPSRLHPCPRGDRHACNMSSTLSDKPRQPDGPPAIGKEAFEKTDICRPFKHGHQGCFLTTSPLKLKQHCMLNAQAIHVGFLPSFLLNISLRVSLGCGHRDGCLCFAPSCC